MRWLPLDMGVRPPRVKTVAPSPSFGNKGEAESFPLQGRAIHHPPFLILRSSFFFIPFHTRHLPKISPKKDLNPRTTARSECFFARFLRRANTLAAMFGRFLMRNTPPHRARQPPSHDQHPPRTSTRQRKTTCAAAPPSRPLTPHPGQPASGT